MELRGAGERSPDDWRARLREMKAQMDRNEALASLEPQDRYASVEEGASELLPHTHKAAQTFPGGSSSGLQKALAGSLQKVVHGRRSGQLEESEARVCLEMMRELMEGLEDLSDPGTRVTRQTNYSRNFSIYTVRATDGDEFVVKTRRRACDRGQARIAIEQTVNDGMPIKPEYQMHLRLDLDPEFGAAVDVQFGKGELDAKVHGYDLDDQGDPKISQFGKPIVKHHFEEGIDPSLLSPDGFADEVESFVNGTLAFLPRGF